MALGLAQYLVLECYGVPCGHPASGVVPALGQVGSPEASVLGGCHLQAWVGKVLGSRSPRGPVLFWAPDFLSGCLAGRPSIPGGARLVVSFTLCLQVRVFTGNGTCTFSNDAPVLRLPQWPST